MHGRRSSFADASAHEIADPFLMGEVDRRRRAFFAAEDLAEIDRLAEMAMASGIGATATLPNQASPVHALFGEDQGRYLLTVRAEDRAEIFKAAESAGVTLATAGMTGGSHLQLDQFMSISVAKLSEAYETWFPAYMKGAV